MSWVSVGLARGLKSSHIHRNQQSFNHSHLQHSLRCDLIDCSAKDVGASAQVYGYAGVFLVNVVRLTSQLSLSSWHANEPAADFPGLLACLAIAFIQVIVFYIRRAMTEKTEAKVD